MQNKRSLKILRVCLVRWNRIDNGMELENEIGISIPISKLLFYFPKVTCIFIQKGVIGNPRLTWGETYRYMFLAYIYNEK